MTINKPLKLCFLFLALSIILIQSSTVVCAKSGCCSHHGGVTNSCRNGKQVCQDNTTSPTCECEVYSQSVIDGNTKSSYSQSVVNGNSQSNNYGSTDDGSSALPLILLGGIVMYGFIKNHSNNKS